MRIAVLGGSAVWTVSLVQALRALPIELVLHGRNERRLKLVARHARHWLADDVDIATDIGRAVEGADMVVVQIRYGGLEARAEAEQRAWALGCPADETLGPAALHMAMAAAPQLRDLGRVLAERCPKAWVLNMVNPLGISTALLSEAHERVLGICELPHTTADKAAVEIGSFPWRVEGLNHRSFLCVEPAVLDRIGETLVGLPGAWARELGAIPTKYHRVVRESSPPGASRASALIDLRDRIVSELAHSPGRIPPSLGQRVTDWYTDGLVPVIRALMRGSGTRSVNLACDDGLVRERLVRFTPRGFEALPGCLPPAARAWVETFEAHERAVLAAVRRQGPLENALALDPVVSRSPLRQLPPLRASTRR